MSIWKKRYHLSGVRKVALRTVLLVALFWTAIDFVILLLQDDRQVHHRTLFFREILLFSISLIMGYLFVYRMKHIFSNLPLWVNFLLRSCILLALAFAITFAIQFLYGTLILGHTPLEAWSQIEDYVLYKNWLLQKVVYWLSIFMVTQLILIINEKYSPGVFFEILTGKYVNPKVENRIVMFIDLKDSTPIAENLGHRQYFIFIKEFIFNVSKAVINCDGTIYQYVGDEVVCSWNANEKNAKKCLRAVLETRKNIQKKAEFFRRKFGMVPDFRIGINVGEVTIGEIGVIKKDLAMSGDTMNTTARIRSACNELNHHFIVSKGFIELSKLQEWQSKSLGIIDLKGKEEGIELFQLKI
ncbi:MAG: adenylate/guanylate cyclase domain-containing protein [Ginsengibacter sp.]|jgi:adenylate cyclase